MWLLAIVMTIVVVLSVLLYRPFLVLSFNDYKAQVLGLRPRLAHAAMLALIMVTIVGSFQTVGTLLVLGLLVGPPATASLLVRRVPAMMATAALIGVLSVVAGLVISFHANTSGSATMAVVPIFLFFVILTFRSIAERMRHQPGGEGGLRSRQPNHSTIPGSRTYSAAGSSEFLIPSHSYRALRHQCGDRPNGGRHRSNTVHRLRQSSAESRRLSCHRCSGIVHAAYVPLFYQLPDPSQQLITLDFEFFNLIHNSHS